MKLKSRLTTQLPQTHGRQHNNYITNTYATHYDLFNQLNDSVFPARTSVQK